MAGDGAGSGGLSAAAHFLDSGRQLEAGGEDAALASPTLDADVRADAENHPLAGAARMLFLQTEHVTDLEVQGDAAHGVAPEERAANASRMLSRNANATCLAAAAKSEPAEA